MTIALSLIFILGICSGFLLFWHRHDPPRAWILHPRRSARLFYCSSLLSFCYLLSFFTTTAVLLPLLDALPGYDAWLSNAPSAAKSVIALVSPAPVAYVLYVGFIKLAIWRDARIVASGGR